VQDTTGRAGRGPDASRSRTGGAKRFHDDREAVLALFVEYHRTGEERLRAHLVERHLGLARTIARRYSNRGEPFEDLVQVASLALVKAVDRFDPSTGTPFPAFAAPTIDGEIKRYFRDSAWLVRVPRQLQELSRTVWTAHEELTQELARPPSTHEIADSLERQDHEIRAALGAGNAYRGYSLEMPATESGSDDEPLSLGTAVGGVDPGYEAVDASLTVGRLTERLPTLEATVVRLYYFRRMVQAQIAAHLGISQMQVSRLLARGLERMRVEQATASR
jgi:RNA polymerase sigma-B factor